MADSDFLKNFLKTYKPKKSPPIEPYLRLKGMKGFRVTYDANDLIPNKTYIKLVKKCDAFEDNKYSCKAIQDGGTLFGGGYFLNGKFEKSNDRSEWIYLKLDTIISKKTGKEQKKFYSYYIKIFDYYIFYTYIDITNNLDIVLIGS